MSEEKVFKCKYKNATVYIRGEPNIEKIREATIIFVKSIMREAGPDYIDKICKKNRKKMEENMEPELKSSDNL